MPSSYPHVCKSCARHATLKEVESAVCMDCGGPVVLDKHLADSYLGRLLGSEQIHGCNRAKAAQRRPVEDIARGVLDEWKRRCPSARFTHPEGLQLDKLIADTLRAERTTD